MISNAVTTLDIICNILAGHIQIDGKAIDPKTIHILNQEFIIPPDNRVYFTVSADNHKVIANPNAQTVPGTGAIEDWEIAVPGSGYAKNDVLTIGTTTGVPATLKVLTVDIAGAVLTAELVSAGTVYTPHNNVATTVAPAGGTGCKVNILAVNGLTEQSSMSWTEPVTVIVESLTDAAYRIIPDVIMAMSAQIAQQLSEQYSIRIARIPLDIKNLCYREGDARIFKFGILFNVISGAELEQSVDYFDNFTGEVLTEKDRIDFIQI